MEDGDAGVPKRPTQDFVTTTTQTAEGTPTVGSEGSVSGQSEFTGQDSTLPKVLSPKEMSLEDMENFVAGWVASSGSPIPELLVFRLTGTFPMKYSTDGSTGPSPEEAEA